MSNTKDKLIRFLMGVKKGSFIPYTKKEVMENTGCSYYTLQNEAIRMDLTFVEGRGYHKRMPKERVDEILQIIEENPTITYGEVAKRYGLSRQRVYQIVKRYGGRKSTQVLRTASKQRIERMLRYYQSNPPEHSLSSALLRFKVDSRTYHRYMEVYGKSQDAQHFEKIHKRGFSKAEHIRELLQNGEYSVTEIASMCETSLSYVCKIRRDMCEYIR